MNINEKFEQADKLSAETLAEFGGELQSKKQLFDFKINLTDIYKYTLAEILKTPNLEVIMNIPVPYEIGVKKNKVHLTTDKKSPLGNIIKDNEFYLKNKIHYSVAEFFATDIVKYIQIYHKSAIEELYNEIQNEKENTERK